MHRRYDQNTRSESIIQRLCTTHSILASAVVM